MKKTVQILLIATVAISLNSCFLFGGGKSKCGDCPTWSQQESEEIEPIRSERV